MLTFAHPAALLALAGLLVPLAIHLWNRRPGALVQVGALRWLTPGTNRRLRQLRLSQVGLLLLRLLLLTLLVGVLAAPRWVTPPPAPRPQVLLSSGVIGSAALGALRADFDSLRRRGAQFRLLAAGFRVLPDSVLAQPRPLSSASAAAPADYWPLAVQAAEQFPGSALLLFTDARQQHFRGVRPALPARLRWRLLPTGPDSVRWLESASRLGPDSLRLITGTGTADYTHFSDFARRTAGGTVPAENGMPALRLSADGQRLRPTGSAQAPAVRLAAPLRVAVYYDAATRGEDARFVRAALLAVRPHVPGGLRLRIGPTPPPATDSLDWLLWLADAPLPAVWQRRVAGGLQLLTDAAGTPQSTDLGVQTPESEAAFRVYRRVAPAPAAPGRWLASDNQPLLTQRRQGRGSRWQLLTRLNPAWCSLPDDGQLPALLLGLLAPPPAAPGPDYRTLDPAQLRRAAAAPEPAIRRAGRVVELGPILALAVGLLFGLERLLAQRRRNGAAA